MLVPPESSSAVLVTISSKSVLVCNRFHAELSHGPTHRDLGGDLCGDHGEWGLLRRTQAYHTVGNHCGVLGGDPRQDLGLNEQCSFRP